jgi:hypothetical protein
MDKGADGCGAAWVSDLSCRLTYTVVLTSLALAHTVHLCPPSSTQREHASPLSHFASPARYAPRKARRLIRYSLASESRQYVLMMFALRVISSLHVSPIVFPGLASAKRLSQSSSSQSETGLYVCASQYVSPVPPYRSTQSHGCS